MSQIENINKALKNTEISIQKVRIYRMHFTGKAKPISLRVVDIKLFLLLQSFDLLSYHKNFLNATLELEKKLFGRLASLHFHEFIQDVRQLLGKEFRKQVGELLISEHEKHIREQQLNLLFKELNDIMDKVKQFDDKYGVDVKAIRNEVIAHKGHDPLQQIEMMENINVDSFLIRTALIHAISIDLDNYLDDLLKTLEKVQ